MADLFDDVREIRAELGLPPCRGCGCSDDHGCPEGCWWATPDLCSNCAELADDSDALYDEPGSRAYASNIRGSPSRPFASRLIPRTVA
jgi:hypothetical protein